MEYERCRQAFAKNLGDLEHGQVLELTNAGDRAQAVAGELRALGGELPGVGLQPIEHGARVLELQHLPFGRDL